MAKLHLLLDAASKRHLRQHVMVCIKALFAVQQEVLRVWSSGSPAQPGLLAMEIRCHNAQFPQVDVIQAHHTALVGPCWMTQPRGRACAVRPARQCRHVWAAVQNFCTRLCWRYGESLVLAALLQS